MEKLNAVREQYRKLLDALINESNFAYAMVENYSPEYVRDEWCDVRALAEKYSFQVASGACRLILSLNESEYIIKLSPDPAEHYSEYEARTYAEAVKVGFNQYFAPCYFLFDYTFESAGNKKVVPVFAMAKCSCDEEEVYSSSCEYHAEEYRKDNNLGDEVDVYEEGFDTDYCGDTEGMLIYAYHVWKLGERVDWNCELFQFMHKMGVNDIHCGNWGYLDGRLVLVDYGGYGSTSEVRRHF